jgi:hypothetical protein
LVEEEPMDLISYGLAFLGGLLVWIVLFDGKEGE